MKIDLDELERKARAEIEARASAPKSLQGEPLVTLEMAEACWAHQQAVKSPVVLALLARIRELEAEVDRAKGTVRT